LEKERIKREKKERKKNKKQGSSSNIVVEKPVVGKVIGSPTNFSHDTHVGWDAERGFEVRNIPAEWKKLFVAAGVKKEEIEDPETRKLLVDTVCASMYMMSSPAPPSGGPPPPASGGPPPPVSGGPPPPMGGGGPPMPNGSGPPPPSGGLPPKAVDPYAPGSKCEAKWSGDGQFYAAQIESVREENGAKIVTVTFTEYGNVEEVAAMDVKVASAGAQSSAPPVAAGGIFAGLANAKSNLKSVDLTSISEQQEEDLVGSLQKALKSRRAGMFSVYHQNKEGGGGEEEEENDWDDEEDEDWMDF